LRTVANDETDVTLRAHTIELLTEGDGDKQNWLDPKQPAAVRLAAIGKLRGDTDASQRSPISRSIVITSLG